MNLLILIVTSPSDVTHLMQILEELQFMFALLDRLSGESNEFNARRTDGWSECDVHYVNEDVKNAVTWYPDPDGDYGGELTHHYYPRGFYTDRDSDWDHPYTVGRRMDVDRLGKKPDAAAYTMPDRRFASDRRQWRTGQPHTKQPKRYHAQTGGREWRERSSK